MCLHIESDLNGIILHLMNVNFIFSGESGIQVGHVLRQESSWNLLKKLKGTLNLRIPVLHK